MSIESSNNDIPKNRPEGATHWAPETAELNPSFAKQVDGRWLIMTLFSFTEGSKSWAPASTTDDQSRYIALKAPEPDPVWATIPDGAWSHDSLADLIRESTEHDGTCPIQVGTVVYRGIKRFDDPASFIPGADEIINDMANNAAASDAGEWADDYPNVTDDAQAELNDFLTAWARKHAPVEKFYCVDAVEVYTVTAEDLAR